MPDINEFTTRIEKIVKRYPYIICECDGKISGYAYASKHSKCSAYKYSADISVYVVSEYQNQGIGRTLYTELLNRLQEQKIYTVYAGITLPNKKSVGLHKVLGFDEVGSYHNVGYKFGKWLDVL